MTKAKTVIIGTIIVAALVTALVLQHRANLRQAADIEALRRQLVERPRPQPSESHAADAEEVDRLRRERQELIRLRGEVAALRQRVTAAASNTAPTVNRTASAEPSPVGPVTEKEVAEFLKRPAKEQGSLLGSVRGQPRPGWSPTAEWARGRALAEKVRPSLDQLESRPAEFAEFQTSFIQAAVGLQDESKLSQIKEIIRSTYEQAVAAHLDAASRPTEASEDWGVRRDALDRPATRAVQQLLTQAERERFDRLFLGVMGIDLGVGDGAWHRFVQGDGAVVFPSEQSQPATNP